MKSEEEGGWRNGLVGFSMSFSIFTVSAHKFVGGRAGCKCVLLQLMDIMEVWCRLHMSRWQDLLQLRRTQFFENSFGWFNIVEPGRGRGVACIPIVYVMYHHNNLQMFV